MRIHHEAHGMSGHPLYSHWRAMRNRCVYTSDPEKARHYKDKGIRICAEWSSFTKFAGWALLNGYAIGLTLDRVDPNGDYCPENCRWATAFAQGQTKSVRADIEIDGVTKTVSQWSRYSGIPISTLFRRYYKGVIGKAFIAPIDSIKSHPKSRKS